MEDGVRAEEILLIIWKKIREMREAGGAPEKIILGPSSYRLLQEYRARLGDLPNPGMDYITRDSLFTLPVYIDADVTWEVQAK